MKPVDPAVQSPGDGWCNRREFLGRCAAASAALLAAHSALLPTPALARDDTPQVEARYYARLPGNETHCHLCPHDCILADGETGQCRTRTNHGGTLACHAYNNPCILNADPIEKLPLLHFLPGTKALTLGLAGCSLRCLYCQNWQVSQESPAVTRNLSLSARDAVAQMKKQDLATVAFTYTEPAVFFEYAREVAKTARADGRRAVMASAAYLQDEPMKDLSSQLDGMCLALKGFTEAFYRKICGASLAPVLKAIEVAAASGTWVEITTLIVPTGNDSLEEMRGEAEWIVKHVGRDVPFHLGRFVPEYRLSRLPPTPIPTLEKCRDVAMAAGLRYVYLSNVAPHPANHTYCPKCQTAVIRRVGFRLLENRLVRGACPQCGERVPGVWA